MSLSFLCMNLFFTRKCFSHILESSEYWWFLATWAGDDIWLSDKKTYLSDLEKCNMVVRAGTMDSYGTVDWKSCKLSSTCNYGIPKKRCLGWEQYLSLNNCECHLQVNKTLIQTKYKNTRKWQAHWGKTKSHLKSWKKYQLITHHTYFHILN